MQLPQVLTSPRAWGIQVEWLWPENSGEHSRLEMQYLNADGRLQKQVIAWPLAGVLIAGLKAGERLQIRLRPIDKNGAVREWMGSDWIEGVSSSNAEEYLNAMAVSSDMRLMTTLSVPNFKIVNGEVFIKNAFIGNGLTTDDKIRLREHGLSEQDLENASASRQGFEQHTVGSAASVSYTMNIGINRDKPVQSTVTIKTPKFKINYGVDTNLEAVLDNALKNAAECADLDVAKQMAADKKAMDELTSHVRKAIMMECFPGGVIWQQCRR